MGALTGKREGRSRTIRGRPSRAGEGFARLPLVGLIEVRLQVSAAQVLNRNVDDDRAIGRRDHEAHLVGSSGLAGIDQREFNRVAVDAVVASGATADQRVERCIRRPLIDCGIVEAGNGLEMLEHAS